MHVDIGVLVLLVKVRFCVLWCVVCQTRLIDQNSSDFNVFSHFISRAIASAIEAWLKPSRWLAVVGRSLPLLAGRLLAHVSVWKSTDCGIPHEDRWLGAISFTCLADMTRRDSHTNTHASKSVGPCCSHVNPMAPRLRLALVETPRCIIAAPAAYLSIFI